jgi:hypothetical protein
MADSGLIKDPFMTSLPYFQAHKTVACLWLLLDSLKSLQALEFYETIIFTWCVFQATQHIDGQVIFQTS